MFKYLETHQFLWSIKNCPSTSAKMFETQSKQNLEFLAIQYFALMKIGIDMNTLKRKEMLRNYWKFFFWIICVIYVELCLINFVVYSGVTNIDAASGSLSIFNQGCLVLFKLAIFLKRGDKFMKLVWDINFLSEKANAHEKRKWLSENLRAQLIGKMYFYTCWAVVICSSIFPLVVMAFDYKQGNPFNRKLPFGGKFPYENYSIFLFIVNYILSVLYIYGMLNMTNGVDGLYIWYIHSISAHFRILRCKVESAALKLLNDNSKNFTQDIGALVSYHNRTLRCVKDLNAIFGEILWAEVMLSCLQMCFAIYTLSNDNKILNMPLNCIVLIAGFMQMTIYCFGGEKIKNESFMLSLELYLTFPWHSMTSKEKKLILLPLLRSQRLSVLSGLFFEVDRSLLVYILKTAFSFNALLTAIKE